MDLLSDWVAPLNEAVFNLWGSPVSWAELLGFITGGLCVWLTTRGSIANFPVGIVNCAMFLVLFASARLWADAGLQIVFIVLGIIGWWQWFTGRTSVREQSPIREADRRTLLVCLLAVVVGTAVLTVILRATHDSSPFLDALTTSLSLVAQWLLNTKRVATWFFWIAADCIYIPLYASKDLYLTAIVYTLFLALCVDGLRRWRAAAAVPETVAA